MARKNKKKHTFRNIIITLIILAIIGAIGYFGYMSYVEIDGVIKDVEGFTFTEPEEIGDKIDLPDKIGEKVTIEWASSNEKYLSNNGEVIRPTFEETDATVTMTGKIVVTLKQPLSKVLLNLLGKDIKDITFTVTIPRLPATDEDKVKSVINRLDVTNETFTSLTLPTTLCFDGLTIRWDSLNDTVMTDNGKVTTPLNDTLITLKAYVKSGDYEESREFKITILKQEKELVEINDHFDDQAKTSRYNTITSTGGVTYENGRIILVDESKDPTSDMTDDINKLVPAYIRMRNQKEEVSAFNVPKVLNPTSFSFLYRFSGDQAKAGSKLVVTITTDKGEVKQEIPVNKEDNKEFKLYTLDLSSYKEASIKVEFVDVWTTDTYIDIDEVKVNTNASIKDLEDYIINNTPSKVSTSVILPFTTIYGGEITWESNNKSLTSTGIVTKGEEATKVTMTCHIKYLDEEATITKEILVVGINSSDELEIHFIDIGKYGAGDCGESIYIKFGNIDIIVDAGDNFSDTGRAVVEAIKNRMQDDKIEYVIATHPDADHIGGMPTLFDAFQIETLIKFEGGYNTKKYDRFVESYTNEGCKVYDIGTDIVNKNLQKKFISINNDIYIDFIDTKYYVTEDDKGKPMESNGRSIVFVLNAYDTRVLFTGDADNAPNHPHLEQNYMNEVGDIDILKVVHHGTRNGTDLDFLNVVKPEMAIICNGNYLGNKHGHPTPKAISNLYTYNPNMKVYAITGGGTIDGVVNKTNGTYKCSSEDRFTDRNGLITITIDNNGYEASSEYFNTNMMEMKNTHYYKAILENGLA